MTTEQLRKRITVTRFRLSDTGIYITYTNTHAAISTHEKTLNLNKFQSVTELERIGSITKSEANPHVRVWWDSIKGAPLEAYWEQFVHHFILSQYEALTIVIRHEYEKSLESDMDLLEIDKALEALK